MSTRWSANEAKKPTERLSGDQNGSWAPSVPGSAWASSWSSDRRYRRSGLAVSDPDATNTMYRPSGESAELSGCRVGGVTIWTRISGGGDSRK
jgi:hypothetical protein